jgi:FtsH-binding integral membrane protein
MTTTATPMYVPLSHDESRTLLGRTMALVSITAAAFAVGAYLGRDSSGGWAFLWFLASLVTLLTIQAAVQRSEQLAVGLLLLFGLFLGLASATTIGFYIDSDPRAVWEAGIATALFMAGFGAAGYATRRDLSGLSRTLLWALVGLIGLGLVLVFVQVPGGALIYTVLGLVIFAGLTLLDFQRLRRNEDSRSAPVLAASIFLDALNVFWLFLPTFGNDER